MPPRLPWFLVLLTSSSGCASARTFGEGIVIDQVAFDHGCPRERVKIVKEEPAVAGFHLDVCGSRRRYRRVADDKPIFVDVTNRDAELPSPR
jgi:hypothetical protein